MDPENQTQVKRIADESGNGNGSGEVIVVLGASDIEGALISAETVTLGDPSFAGPLAGVSLRLPVYHILEPVIREAVPEDVYEENAGIWALTIDQDQIGQEFESVRAKVAQDA